VGIEDFARAASMGPEDLGSVGDLEWAEFRAMGEEFEFAEGNERGDVSTTPEYIYCGWCRPPESMGGFGLTWC
jgi:hypothetical protein